MRIITLLPLILILILFLPVSARQLVASHEPFRFITSIQSNTKNGWKHRCTGALVNENFVISSQGCIENINKKTLRVRVGSYNNAFNGKIRKVAEKEYHKGIALLRLRSLIVKYRPVLISLTPYLPPYEQPGQLQLVLGYSKGRRLRKSIVEISKCSGDDGGDRICACCDNNGNDGLLLFYGRDAIVLTGIFEQEMNYTRLSMSAVWVTENVDLESPPAICSFQ